MIVFPKKNRFALLTVDTEGLPKRVSADHVKRLIWGQHKSGAAGIKEIIAIGKDFNARHVFFVDLCGAYSYLTELCEVVRWLDHAGQDVQLHAHPEALPPEFWELQGFSRWPACMNEYSDDARAEFVIQYFGGLIFKVTGKKIRAFRAGSFRWNSSVIRALKKADMPLSFNNSMRAYRTKNCTYSEPTNLPYIWSNGVIEVPITEKRIPPRPGKTDRWTSLTYPESTYFPFQEQNISFLSKLLGTGPHFLVLLLHSWSLLYWDENGHATYRDDRRLEGYRKLLARLTKDYDVITTQDFLDLYARGKIVPTHTVDVAKAELHSAP